MFKQLNWVKAFERATDTRYDTYASDIRGEHIFVSRVGFDVYRIPHEKPVVFEEVEWEKPKVRATRRMSKKGR